jgi:LacI family gluconate utilization system Gnt-I transcriptional repressor
MRDVARKAGVSRMTVSRALRKNSSISQETRTRILKVVRDMNYVPDQMAGSLTTKRSGFVAVLVPSLNNLHFAETVQALTEELEKIDRQVILGYTDYSDAREEKLIENMLRRRPEAIVLSYDGHSDRTIQLLSDVSVPVIELWERPEDPIGHSIGFSNRDAALEMTTALIEMGYRDIAFIGEADDDWTRGAERRQGFVQAMETAGLSAHRVLQLGKPPLSIEHGAEAAKLLLQRFPDSDCAFCVSDPAAFGFLSAIKAAGKRVPEDIGIVGFGNFEVSRFASPQITTVVVDPYEIGRATGLLISQILEGSSESLPAHKIIKVRPEISFRSSTQSRKF